MKDNSHVEDAIEQVLLRGVANIYPSIEFVRAQLRKGTKLTIYLGIDPTAPTLHLGNAVQLKKLAEFQELGHQIILLIGDFTAQIGDPTGKSSVRKALTKKEVQTNMKKYLEQASAWLRFSGKNKALVRYNSQWLAKMDFADVLKLAATTTVQQMIERDMFQERLRAGQPIYIHEFMYPLMQGYDSVALNVDGEIGGNDQTFNMLMGRTLLKEQRGTEKFVITVKLLVDANGKKMGKTEGNMVSLDDSAENMYGKIMSWTDSMIVNAFELCTRVPFVEVLEIKKALENGAHPMEYKKRLAREIVSVYHGNEKANKAEQQWVTTFSDGKAQEGKKVHITIKAPLVDILIENGFVKSKSDFRRLLQEGAIKAIVKEEERKIVDPNTLIDDSTHLKIGKKKFLTITFKKK